MHLRFDFENHYCTSCHVTWKHKNHESITTCLRCGVSKPLHRTTVIQKCSQPEREDQDVEGAGAPTD